MNACRKRVVLIFATILIAQCSAPVLATDATQIEALLVGYMEAAINRDGNAVAATLSAATLQWWTDIIQKSLTATKADLQALSMYETQSVLFIRLRLSREERRAWDGQTYIEESYNNGWNSSKALEHIRVIFPECAKSWKIDQETAILSLMYKGKPVRGEFKFVQEAGAWKIDGIEQTRLIEERMQEAQASSGLSKEKYIERILAQIAGGTFPAELWNPAAY